MQKIMDEEQLLKMILNRCTIIASHVLNYNYNNSMQKFNCYIYKPKPKKVMQLAGASMTCVLC